MVPPENFSWEMLDVERFLVTLDLSSFDLELEENVMYWLAIAPEFPAGGGFFYQTFIEDSAAFSGVSTQTFFGTASMSFDEEEGDRAFRITGQLPGVPYKRGDADGNGVVNFLVDSLFELNFGFVPGASAPPCMATADTDGNRVFNPLVDALYGLNAGFVPGSLPPPPPFPECGADPNGFAVLGCDTPPSCL